MLQRIQNSQLVNGVSLMTTVDVSRQLVLATLAVSSALGLGALALGWRMPFIALIVLAPWMPILARKLRADWLAYGMLALFELLVILQIGHFAEHVSQMIELHFLNWVPTQARGIIGELDIEPVHFWWNLIILAAGTLLLFRYGANGWLLASWSFSIWHQIEHIYIYFWWYLPHGISGHPGILGAGGLVAQAAVGIPVLTTLGRADLHFWYNLVEITLFIVAFLFQARRTLAQRT